MYEGHGGTPFPHGLHTFHMQYVNWLFQIDGVTPYVHTLQKMYEGGGVYKTPGEGDIFTFENVLQCKLTYDIWKSYKYTNIMSKTTRLADSFQKNKLPTI